MFRVRVDTGQTGQILNAMFHRGRDLTPVLRTRVAPDQLISIHKNFDVSGRPPWAPLKASTLGAWMGRYKKGGAYRTKGGGLTKKGQRAMAGRKPLLDTGALRRSVRVHKVSPRSLQMGAGGGSVPYAAIHQFGAPKKRIPARPFMVWQPEDLAVHQHNIRHYIITGG